MRMPRALYRPGRARTAGGRFSQGAVAAGLAAIMTLALAGGAGHHATAQESDTAALQKQVRELQDQIRTLRRNLAALRSDLRSGGNGGSPAARKISQEEIPPTVAARFEVRMSQLERAIRTLTGKVEDLAFSVRQTRKDLKKQENDFGYRLDRLEKSPRTASAAGGDNRASRPTTGRVPPPSRPATDGGAGSGAGDDRGQASVLPDGPPATQYRYAFGLLRKRENQKAIDAFKEFVAKHPRSRLSGNAYHWLGRLYFDAKNYKEAARAFAAGYQKFRRHARAADNLLMLGVSLARIDQKNLACKSFAELRNSFPNAAPDVRRRALRESRQLGCR